jgi:msm operon regulatory protein
MLVFSEYQTDTIDLALDFYGYEDCPKNYEFGPSVRDNFVLHFITEGKGVFHFNKKEIHLEAGDLFLLPKNMVTYYKADAEEPWSYYWIGISGTKVSDFMRFSTLHEKGFSKENRGGNRKDRPVYGATRPQGRGFKDDFTLPTPPSLSDL